MPKFLQPNVVQAFQTVNSVISKNPSLKYERFTSSGCKKQGCENLSLWQRLNFFASYLSVRKLRNRGVTMSESRTSDVHGFQWVSTKCRCIYDIISILNFLTCFYKIINSIITLFLSYSGLHKPAEQEDDCQTYSKRLYSVHYTCNFN